MVDGGDLCFVSRKVNCTWCAVKSGLNDTQFILYDFLKGIFDSPVSRVSQ